MCLTKRPALWVTVEVRGKVMVESRVKSICLSTVSKEKTWRLVEAIWSTSKSGALGYLMFPAMN